MTVELFQRQIPTVQAYDAYTSRLDFFQYLVVKTLIGNMSKNKPSTRKTHVACKSKLRSVLRSSIHPTPRKLRGKWVCVACYARAAHAFSAGINYRHCTRNPMDFQSLFVSVWINSHKWNLEFRFSSHLRQSWLIRD